MSSLVVTLLAGVLALPVRTASTRALERWADTQRQVAEAGVSAVTAGQLAALLATLGLVALLACGGWLQRRPNA